MSTLEDLELRFDDAGRVTRVRWLRQGGSRQATIVHEPGGDVVVHWPDGRETRFKHVASRADDTSPQAETRVQVPVATPARLDERLRKLEAGSEPWLLAQRERLVACAATADTTCLGTTLDAIVASRGKATKGEIALASRGLTRAPDEAAKKALGSIDAADPVRRAVEAARTADATARRAAFTELASKKGRLASWMKYRALLLALESESQVSAALAGRVEAFAADRDADDELRFLLVRSAAERTRWSEPALSIRLWKSLSGDPDLGFLADRSRALIDPWSNPAESSALLLSSFDAALDRGLAPSVDHGFRNIVARGQGEVGYGLFWARWRDRLTERGNAAQLASFLDAAAQGFRPTTHVAAQLSADIEPLLARLENAPDADLEARLRIASALIQHQYFAEAERALAVLLAEAEPSPEALELASVAAEKLGRFGDAAALVERAIRAAAFEEVPMDRVRSRYARLLELEVRRAKASPSQTALALAGAVETAKMWRREDPDNADVDLTVAAAMDRLGLRDEARRQLHSIIDRHPGEGDAIARVAGEIEARGDFDGAVPLWNRAIEAEPTNPTWLLRKAQVLRVRAKDGDVTTARELFQKIVDGKWQDRFAPQVNEARALMTEGKR